MIASENLSAADIAAVTNSNNGLFGGEGGGLFWLLVLFMFGFGSNGGWGNGFGNNNASYIDSSIQRGFDQSAVMNGLNGLNTAVTAGFGGIQNALCGGFAGVNAGIANGFAQNEISNNARQIADMNQNFAMQTSVLQGFNGVQGQLAGLGADIARENCADRQAISEAMMGLTAQNNMNTNLLVTTINQGIQSLKDMSYQQQLDAERRENENLRTQLNMANLVSSQNLQTAQIVADNTAQTQYIVNRVAPYPIPSYTVPNPYGTATTATTNG